MRQESLLWRPEKGSLTRAWQAVGSAARTPIDCGPWRPDTLSFSTFSTLLCDLDFGVLNSKQREVIFGFFQLAMYYNRYLDLLVYRTRRGRESLMFIEKFWCLPQRMADLREKGQEAGYDTKVLQSAEDWFSLNRILNFTSFELAKGGSIPWEEYGSGLGESADCSEKEKELFRVVHEAFEQRRTRDPISQAILFRAFSSVGFAKPLIALGQNSPFGPDFENRGRLRRMGAMIMITQLLDDVGTPSKDVRFEIAGMASSAFKESRSQSDGSLLISRADAKGVVSLARQIMGTCLEEVNIDPSNQAKQLITRLGLLLLAGVSTLTLKCKYGGSRYPIPSMLKAAVFELISAQPGEDYRQVTREAINVALNSLTDL